MRDPIARLNAALEGRYRIERQLGEGGMATVYLAADLRHDRGVALKVLKPELAAVVGAERFLAEIKTTAKLQHPHILPLHDSGEADSFLFYVMPYVEGESLRERLDREHQLPVDEAVRIATNVAEALDYAHRHGVIHRDVKPANILLQDGKPVVSDFGIALAVSAGGGGRLTETGLSLGTPHYMSPEQATGDLTVGPAADVYALGCVLYEMLVGEPPYTGSTAQAILGKIVTGEPDAVTKHRRSVPANVDAAIRRALEKLPADRFSGAEAFEKALADSRFWHGAEQRDGLATRSTWTGRSAALASLLGVTAILLVWSLLRTDPPATSLQSFSFTVPVGEGADAYLGGDFGLVRGRPSSRSLALSPDGRMLVYSGWTLASDGQVTSRIYLRRLDREEAVPLPGTEGASSPFFSPDGAWVGFLDSLALRRVSVTDNDVVTIVQSAAPFRDADQEFILDGADWSENGTIAYAGREGLYRVAAAGGEPELILDADAMPAGLRRVGQPEWLPGGRVILLGALGASPGADPVETEVFALDLTTGTRTTVLTNALDPHYVEPGILVFMRVGTLMAIPFDPGTFEVSGEPVTMVEDVMQALNVQSVSVNTGIGQVALSRVGHLAFASGGPFPPVLRSLVRVRGVGEADPLEADPALYINLRVSPDGNRLLYSAGADPTRDLFVYDLDRRVSQRLNTGFSFSWFPAWSPDGRAVAFSVLGEGANNIYRMPVDQSAPPEAIAPSTESQIMGSWSATGAIAYIQGNDIWVLPPGGDPAPFVASAEVDEQYPTFAPNGRWLAYTVRQEDTWEVYVRPYPGPGPATLVSADGGRSPAWSPDGRRLYYLGPQGDPPHPAMMAVDIDVSDGLRAGSPVPFIDPWRYVGVTPIRSYDVAPDGSFIAARASESLEDFEDVGDNPRMADRVGQIHVVTNWVAQLRERVAAR